jgi:hypothetical protein
MSSGLVGKLDMERRDKRESSNLKRIVWLCLLVTRCWVIAFVDCAKLS